MRLLAICLAVVADQQLWERSDRISRRPVTIAGDGAFACEPSADTRDGDGAANAEQRVVDPLDEIASEFASLPRRQFGPFFGLLAVLVVAPAPLLPGTGPLL